MKKTLLVLTLVMLTFTAAAKPVDRTTALRVASNFMSLNGVSAQLTDITLQSTYSNFYIFTAGEGGFVLVSADDCVTPILAYSTHSAFDARHIPENVKSVLDQYEEEIAVSQQEEGLPADSDWQTLIAGTLPEPVDPTAVAPLLSTSWGQQPYYNNLCPYDNNYSERTVTGCVATATAQIMKKWNHPTTGYGSNSYVSSNDYSNYGTQSADFGATTYQWSSMPNSITSSSSSTQVNAVATLMYHIGVAVEMEFDISSHGGSAASNYNYFGYIETTAESALQRNFKYRADMAALAREDYSNAEYINLLKADLDAGRPILYSGRDSDGGHSFVCDGYNTSDKFHINWGWRGSYDGYYTMGALNPAGGGTGANAGTYNLSNVALTRIQPNTDWSPTGTTTVTANATGGTGCSVSGAGSYAFGDTIHLHAVAATGYHFTGWSDGCKFNPRECIANGGTLSFTAQFEPLGGDTITYCPGNRYLTSLGASSGTSKWGIRIPASALTSGQALTKVQFFATATGSHTITVYSGTSSPTTTLHSGTFSVSGTGWRTVNLGAVTPTSGEDLWIAFSTTQSHPAAMSYSGGHNYGLLWGSNLSYAGYTQCSWMIRAIFGDGTPPAPPANPCLITSFPFTETFDDTSRYSCLYRHDANGDGQSWAIIDSFGTNYSHAAYIMYAVQADDYLILPGITTPGNYTITWKARAYRNNYPESYQVYAGNTMIFSETISATNLTSRSATFTVAAGDTVNPKFRYISDDMYAFFIDDVTISNTPPASIDETAGDAWRIHPNPATNAVTILGIGQAKVIIKDLTGRMVATHNVTAGGSIDVSDLAAGAYFLQITSDGTNAIRKLIIK